MVDAIEICTRDHTLHITYKNSLRRIADLMGFALGNPPIDALMRALVSQTLMPFGVLSATVLLRDEENHFNIHGKFGLSAHQAKALTKIRLDSAHPIALSMQTTNHVYVHEAKGLGEIFGAQEAVLLLPVVRHEEIFGVLVLVFHKQNKIDDIDELFFSIISNILTQFSLNHIPQTSKNDRAANVPAKTVRASSSQDADQVTEFLLADLGLTPRQHEIAVMIADGITNREIARKMAYSEATIRYETIKLYERLRVRNRSHAAARIRELKIA